MKIRKLNPVFSRYLIILVVFSVLLCILFIPVYLYIFNFTLTNELTYIYNRFQWGVSSLDTAISAVNNTALLTNRDSRFRIFTQDRQDLEMNPVLLNEIRSHFNGILLSYPVIEDAGIIFSPDVILTRQEIFYFSLLYPFYGPYIQCENLAMDDWLSFISVTNSLLPVQHYTNMRNASYEGLSYSVQWKSREEQEINILYATLPVKNILSMLTDDEILSQGAIRIYNSEGTTLFNHSGEHWNPQEKFRILTDKSRVTSAYFELAIPESIISGKMNPVKRLMFSFSLLTVFFIICLSLFFAYKWSLPMRRFLSGIDSTKIFKNEYEQNVRLNSSGLWNYFRRLYEDVSKSINVIDNKLENSLRTIEGQTSLLKEQIFYKALNQGIYSEQDGQLFSSLFVDFPAFFQLASISYEQSDSYEQQENSSLLKTTTAQLQLINAIKNQIENIYIHSMGENTIILLLPLKEKDITWYEKLQDLRSDLNRQIDLALHFSLSIVYEKPPDLIRAWQELQSISSALGIEELSKIGRISDVPNHKNRMRLNIVTLQMIYNALNNGNNDTACNILAECTNDLAREKDIFLLSIISNLIHDTLMLFKRENPVILVNEEIPRHIPGREDELLNKQYPECFRRIGKLIRQNKEESISRFGARILDYINQNLSNPNLYSGLVQDHFNISRQTLHIKMKEATGRSFQSYVEDHRMAKARDLLAEGASTIQEIAEKCGFSNANSFYIAFKRIFGYPPSDILGKK